MPADVDCLPPTGPSTHRHAKAKRKHF